MEVVRNTVPSSGSGVTKAALSKLGSAPRLGLGGGIGPLALRINIKSKITLKTPVLDNESSTNHDHNVIINKRQYYCF